MNNCAIWKERSKTWIDASFLREFLDYKARKEKEEFNAAKEQEITYESYNFAKICQTTEHFDKVNLKLHFFLHEGKPQKLQQAII